MLVGEPREHIYRALPVHIPPSPTNTRWMWAEGVYFKHYNRQVSPLGDELKPEDIDHLIIRSGFADWNMPRPIQAVPVNPATVCERTNKQDSKNAFIWENDVIEFEDTGEDAAGDGFDFVNRARVVLRNDRWELDNFRSTNSSVMADMANCYEEFLSVFERCTVIGNYIDNPGLLDSEN